MARAMTSRSPGVWLSFLFFLLFLFPYRAFSSSQAPAIRVQWLGQSSFLIQAQRQKAKPFRFLWDPYGPQVGYPVPPVQADAVFVSHFHFDHDNVERVPGAKIFHGLKKGGGFWNLFTEEPAPGISLRTVGTYHDSVGGAERGLNSVSILTISGIRLVHLGDLGHTLSQQQIREIQPVDVLFLPVGGVYTIDGREAVKVAEELKPRLIIPMHYKTKLNRIPLQSADLFLRLSPWPVKQAKSDTLILEKNRLPRQTEVLLLVPSSEADR